MSCLRFDLENFPDIKPESLIVGVCNIEGSLNWAMWGEQVGSVYKWNCHVDVLLTAAPG